MKQQSTISLQIIFGDLGIPTRDAKSKSKNPVSSHIVPYSAAQ